jgi:plastocyanin
VAHENNWRGVRVPLLLPLRDEIVCCLFSKPLLSDDAELPAQAATCDEVNRVDENSIRIGAVPNQLAFSPTEIRTAAGRKVTLTFDNSDLQIHNLVIVPSGAVEEVGLLADQMAQDPKTMSRHYLADSDKVIWSSPLVMPGKDTAAEFTAPQKPGSYPYLHLSGALASDEGCAGGGVVLV